MEAVFTWKATKHGVISENNFSYSVQHIWMWCFCSASYYFVLLLLFRLPQYPLRKTLRAQGVGGAEPQAKTPMRSGASSWSVTGLQPLAAGRRGKCGSSLWRRRPRTSTPWTDNYRCSLPLPSSSASACNTSYFICLCFLCIGVSVCVCVYVCASVSVYHCAL